VGEWLEAMITIPAEEFGRWLGASLESPVVAGLIAKFVTARLVSGSQQPPLDWSAPLYDFNTLAGVTVRVQWVVRDAPPQTPIGLLPTLIHKTTVEQLAGPEVLPDVFVVVRSSGTAVRQIDLHDWEFLVSSAYSLQDRLPQTTLLELSRVSTRATADGVAEAIRVAGRLPYVPPGTPEANVVDLIRAGESKRCEFKSSLRWSVKGGCIDEAVTDAAVKTVAAFLNTSGGTLLLGVKDEGEVVGIEVDQFPNSDKFLLHLGNVVREALGKNAAANIDARLVRLRDRSVCVVRCEPSPAGVWARLFKMPPKGQERFFVRTGGASTIELEPSEVGDYLRQRASPSKTKASHTPSTKVSSKAGLAGSDVPPVKTPPRPYTKLTRAEKRLWRRLTDITSGARAWRGKASRFRQLWIELLRRGCVPESRLIELIAPLVAVKGRGQFVSSYSAQNRSPLLKRVSGARFGVEEPCFVVNPAVKTPFEEWVGTLARTR
jgi:hypothetical protein